MTIEQAKARYDAAYQVVRQYHDQHGLGLLDPTTPELDAELKAAADAYNTLSNAQLRERAAVALGQGFGNTEEWG